MAGRVVDNVAMNLYMREHAATARDEGAPATPGKAISMRPGTNERDEPGAGPGRIPLGFQWRCVRSALPSMLAVAGAAAAVITAVAVLFVVTGTRPMQYLDDPAVVTGGSPFAGSVTVLGNFLWVVAATASLMAAATTKEARGGRRSLLLAIGIGSLVLAVDDQFMLHERLLARDLGLSELWLTGPYAAIALWVAWRHRWVIMRHPDAVVLSMGVCFLALSYAIDVGHADIAGRATAEESLKFLGIALWCLFAVRASLRMIGQHGAGNEKL